MVFTLAENLTVTSLSRGDVGEVDGQQLGGVIVVLRFTVYKNNSRTQI